jgi:predicted nucleic acid-binding protein
MNARVVDAGPLLFLARLDRLPLLRLGVEQVFIPSAVLEEVQRKPDPVLDLIQGYLTDWLNECSLTNIEILRILSDLGAGEREVIAQALENHIASVVLDDLDARRRALHFGIQPIGTVGLLLAAKKRQMIPSLKDELQRLKNMGFWVSESLVEAALREAGEQEA